MTPGSSRFSSEVLTHAPALIGLAGLLAFLPFGIAGQQISLGVALLGILLFRDGRHRLISLFRRGKFPTLLRGAILFWVMALLLSLVFSGQFPDGLRELRKVTLLFALIIPACAVSKQKELRFALLLLLVSGIAAASIGLWEHGNHAGLNPNRLDGPINSYMTSAGIFLQISLMALALLLHGNEHFRGITPVAFLLVTAALFFTFTRGAWLGWAVGSAFLLTRCKPRLMLPLLLLLMALPAAHPEIRERAKTMVDRSYPTNSRRLILWSAGWDAFRERPLTGWGLQSMESLILERSGPAPSGHLSHFHSNVVQTAVAMGLAGLVAFTLLMAALFRASSAGVRVDPPSLARGIAEGSAAAVVGFLVHGFFEWNMGDSEVITTLYALVGLAIAANRLNRWKGEACQSAARR